VREECERGVREQRWGESVRAEVRERQWEIEREAERATVAADVDPLYAEIHILRFNWRESKFGNSYEPRDADKADQPAMAQIGGANQKLRKTDRRCDLIIQYLLLPGVGCSSF
jgi:hypothetical protein